MSEIVLIALGRRTSSISSSSSSTTTPSSSQAVVCFQFSRSRRVSAFLQAMNDEFLHWAQDTGRSCARHQEQHP